MEHPLIGDLSELSIEQLQGKISELNKRISFAYRNGNTPMLQQLQLVLASYNTEYQRKMEKLMPKGGDDKYGDKIDIS